MTTNDTPAAPATTRGRGLNITLWVLQILLGLFFIFASAAPKFFGQSDAVRIFDEIGFGQWFRYVVGLLELAGGIGLMIPRLAGLAALGLAIVTFGAAITQAIILSAPVVAIFPAVLCVVFLLIAWARRSETRALLGGLKG